MPLIECRNIRKDFSGDLVLSSVSLALEPGSKTALVGRNGAGKTTLVRILLGRDDDYRGSVVRAPRLRVGYVPQHVEPPEGVSAGDWLMEETLAARAELGRLEGELAGASGNALDALLGVYGALREAYDERNGDEAESEASRWLERAGLAGTADREAARLSGGERNVLALVKALMTNPDLLVLDEPGNHLDFWGLSWLEDFLKGLPKAVLLVSHNRWLIDRVADRVLELEQGRLSEFAGGYSAYRLEKLRRAAGQGEDWQADRKRIERLTELVRRFEQIARARPDPAWGKRLRARRSQLAREKEAATEKPVLDGRRIDLAFRDAESRSDIALDVRGYSRSFGERTLFDSASLDVLTGERVAIVGRNGSGKTTFLTDLVEKGNWDDGVLRIGPSMRVGYCAQDRAVFRPGRTVMEEFEALDARREEAWKLLKRFLFKPEDLDRPIDTLSGGELNRLQLARAVHLKANLLILDEPTNHLDIPGCEAVEEGLAEYPGTILAVSHDRYFLEKVVDRVVLLDDGVFVPYEGSFAEFWRDLGSVRAHAGRGLEGRGRSLKAGGGEGRTGPAGKSPGTPRSRPTVPARRQPAAGVSVEDRIHALEAEKADLEARAAAAFRARDFKGSGRISADLEKLNRRIEKLYGEL